MNDAYNNRDKVAEDAEREMMLKNAEEILGNTSSSGFGLKKKDINFIKLQTVDF